MMNSSSYRSIRSTVRDLRTGDSSQLTLTTTERIDDDIQLANPLGLKDTHDTSRSMGLAPNRVFFVLGGVTNQSPSSWLHMTLS